ncbi:MAG: molybdopterin molybdotransferase MoeA [Coriobacteriales bacterium]|jgi:molybdopterin molybdotransferase/putative molybdopterin biosynthesis protein|nr:molybdopterin molybdotransferase MoeA [Coriobacteriales bacterium]
MTAPSKAPTRQQVLALIQEHWQPQVQTETVALGDALGRVLTQSYQALYNQPVVRASNMDGIAVASARFAQGMPDTSHWRLGVDYVRADTGDDFDDAFDAVIPIEHIVFLAEGGIQIDDAARGGLGNPGGLGERPRQIEPGLNVRSAGVSVRAGEPLAGPGTRMTATDVAALAAGGISHVEVAKRPLVAFIPTGSELIPLGQQPQRGQTIDSNSLLVAQMLSDFGAEKLLFNPVIDSQTDLEAALDRALKQAQIVLINAGSSKGAEDFNAELLAQKGQLLCHWIASAPGRPLAAAIIDGKPVLNIPGPPLATYFVMDWCVGRLVAQALGTKPEPKRVVWATLTEDLEAPPHMEILRRLEVSQATDGSYLVAPLSRSTTTIPQLLRAGAQFVNPLGHSGGFKRGEQIEVELL